MVSRDKNEEVTHDPTALMYTQFKAPFPEDAYSVVSRGAFELTALKAQYIVERLNDVLGIDGWKLTGTFEDAGNGVIYKGKLAVYLPNGPHEIENVGFSEMKKNVGDTYKGAKTDCLSKCSSYLGIGNEMFKGKIKPPKDEKRKFVQKSNKKVVEHTDDADEEF